MLRCRKKNLRRSHGGGQRKNAGVGLDRLIELALSLALADWKGEADMSVGTILLIILVLLLIGALPNWGYSRAWGRGPAGIIGVILVVVLILVLLGRI
jgi:hypothetical protein